MHEGGKRHKLSAGTSIGLRKIAERMRGVFDGKVAIKLHTGEQHGPNILPRPWVRELIENDFPDATIVETNTYYEGDRYTTEQHRETLKVNGWTYRQGHDSYNAR